jgi:serine/threonine-protein kinase
MVGTSISQYRILGTLGKGGTSIVYKARDTKLERFVALKFLREEFCANGNSLDVFLHEARIATRLNHPGICAIYGIDRYGDRPFLVMEYLEGHTLRDRLQAGGFSIRESVNLAVCLADALVHAHSAGIVHRDITPANLFVTHEGRIKLLDFGIAQKTRRKARVGSKKSSGGILTGTIHYMSPEQALCHEVDFRSDIFSTGVVLYQMLSGRRPFGAPDLATMIHRIINEAPAPLVTAGVPAALDAVVQKSLEKQPALRFQSAAALKSALIVVASQLKPDSPAHHPIPAMSECACNDATAETVPEITRIGQQPSAAR